MPSHTYKTTLFGELIDLTVEYDVKIAHGRPPYITLFEVLFNHVDISPGLRPHWRANIIEELERKHAHDIGSIPLDPINGYKQVIQMAEQRVQVLENLLRDTRDLLNTLAFTNDDALFVKRIDIELLGRPDTRPEQISSHPSPS